jgi:hypothetical protein
VSVAGEQPSAVDLRQAPQALGLQQLPGPMQLGEVLLDPGVGKFGERLRPQPSIADRSSLTAGRRHFFHLVFHLAQHGFDSGHPTVSRCDARHV